MVNFFKRMARDFRSLLHYRRCRRAIAEAERRLVTTGRKQLVIMYAGRPLVISKREIKAKIKAGFFAKGFSPEKAEGLAIYKTR